MDSDAADSHLPMPTGGGDAAPDDSGADASVRLAGRTSSTQLKEILSVKFYNILSTYNAKIKIKFFYAKTTTLVFFTLFSENSVFL